MDLFIYATWINLIVNYVEWKNIANEEYIVVFFFIYIKLEYVNQPIVTEKG